MDLKETIELAIRAMENGQPNPWFGGSTQWREAYRGLLEQKLKLENAAEPATPAVGSIWTKKNGSRTLYEVREVETKCLRAPVVIYSSISSGGSLPRTKGARTVTNFLDRMTMVALHRSDVLPSDVGEKPETFRRNNGLAKKYKAGETIDFSTLLDNFAHHVWSDGREGVRVSEETRAARQLFFNQEIREPIPMVLHCPSCGLQHIDGAAKAPELGTFAPAVWNNPPHRSHLCHGCGTIWRPADVPTTGVEKIHTAGKNDTTKAAIEAGRAK